MFQNRYTLCSELSWSHSRLLMRNEYELQQIRLGDHPDGFSYGAMLLFSRIYPQITPEEYTIMTLYTAVGRYEFRKNTAGEKLPHIITGGRSCELDLWEMILWSSLIWNIHTHEEITKIFYRKERDIHVLGELSCDHYIDSLEKKGLIVSGHGVTGMDALHDLLSRLYVVPVRANLFTKTAAFLHLTLIKHIPLKVTRKIFDKEKLSDTEKQLMRLVKQNQLSVGELVKCVECGITDVSTNDKLMDALYDDDDTTYKNIGAIWRSCEANNPVLVGIVTLYLNKHIVFEVLE